MPSFFSSSNNNSSPHSMRSTMQSLDKLLVASGGLKFDDGMKKSMALNNAGSNVTDALSATEQAKYDSLSPYGKDEFKMALELQFLRKQLAQLEEMEENNRQSGGMVVRGSLPHSRQDISKLSGDVRKRIQKLNASAQHLQKTAKAEGKVDEAKEVLRHMENTKGLYKKRFAVARSSYNDDGPEFLGGTSSGEQGSLVNKEMDFNNLDSGSNEIRESLRDDSEFQQFFASVSERDVEIDKLVDTISKGTTRLRDQVLGIQEELLKEKAILAETEEKVDNIDVNMKGLNRKLKQTIKKVDEDRLCIYAICFVLLLGIVGYLLYAAGVFGKQS